MKRILFCLLLPLLVQANAFAQEQKQTIDRADEYFSRYQYALSAPLYEKLATAKKVKPGLLEKLAASYRQTNHYAEAAKWYGQIIQDTQAAAENFLYYGDMLCSLGRYEEAKKAYAAYAQKEGTAALAAQRLAGCDSAVAWIQHPGPYQLDNQDRFNTAQADWGATWYGKDTVVFISDYMHSSSLHKETKINKSDFGWTGNPYQKIYSVDTGKGKTFGFIKDFSATINRYLYHVGPVAFSAGGDTAYITATNPGKLPYKKEPGLAVYGTRRLGLYVLAKQNGIWQKPAPFRYNNTNAYSVGHAALSNDGQVLYFVSDMPGGKGKTDIWYCERSADTGWSAPKNCGDVINTPDEETFPTITAADNALFFSSKGHAGMGGRDLFKAVGAKGQWGVPVNLGYPMNSPSDDFYYQTGDGVTGFIASNRSGGKGEDDIYRFVLNQPVQPATYTGPPVLTQAITVLDKQTGLPVSGAIVELYQEAKKANRRNTTASDGKIYVLLEKQAHYTLHAVKEGYDTTTQTFTAPDSQSGNDTLHVTLYLRHPAPVYKTGDVITLQHFRYDFGKWAIRPDAAAILDQLVTTLEQHPSMKIELASHTDSRGKASNNLLLSRKRAEAAVAYLVQKGIAPARLTARWYGESKPLNHCIDGVLCTEAAYLVNRRTEVKILTE